MSLLSLPLLDSPPQPATPEGIIPLSSGKSCGTGCDDHSKAKKPTAVSNPTPRHTVIPFDQRKLNLDAFPSRGTPITHIDMDLTVACNLRCVYCFKEKWTEHMADEIAFDTMIWLLHASGDIKEVGVSLMGGEPLIRFKLIKKLVPFATRRAAQHGKKIHFSATTNGTLTTDDVIDFWRKWGMGFHTSIDGVPEMQDKNRPTMGGKGSSHLVEKSSQRILALRPGTCARCTVTPESAGALVKSYHYFRSLGYIDIAFVPGGMAYWDERSVAIYEEQYREVAELAMAEFRAGVPIRLKGLDDYAESVGRESRRSHSCGAGRGMALVDIYGNLWPCHRWNKPNEDEWRMGSIYEGFFDDGIARQQLDGPTFADLLEQECHRCVANKMCSGGCPAENLEDTGSVYKRHPNACELTRVWARVGREVYQKMDAERNSTYREVYLKDDDYVVKPGTA